MKTRNHGRCVVLVLVLLLGCLHASAFTPAPLSSPKTTSLVEDEADGIFSDLSSQFDGGVANPTDGSTGNVLQQTLFAAYFWGVAHATPSGPARATVVVASDYAIYGSRLLVPGNVDLVCSSYSPQTFTGGCSISQTDGGSNVASGGSPLLMFDESTGALADHKTRCSAADRPQQGGCVLISSSGASVAGFTLYGGGSPAGGADVGIRIAADNVHVQDTAITGFFGGPGIQQVSGVNVSIDWNYGTNVDEWWCHNPTQLTQPNLQQALGIGDGAVGALEVQMVDGELSNNQYSAGCSFSRDLTASSEYPYLAAMHINGAGDLITNNLFQVEGIAIIVAGEEQRVVDNRFEYTAREAVLSYAGNSLFSGNHILSGCLDHNLPRIMPGSPNNGQPVYPVSPTSLAAWTIVIDANGNVEQVIHGDKDNGSGVTDPLVPDWPDQLGQTVNTTHLTWENVGPWSSGLTSRTDTGTPPGMVNGQCFAVTDLGQNNTYIGNIVGEEVGVDGPSYFRGSYFIPYPGTLTGNYCDQDQPDAFRNGQCWWGGDPFANGGPPGLAPNGKTISASGGGTAWVGDYSVLLLTDTTPHGYSNFQGMASGTFFWVTSSVAANVINTWGVGSGGGSYYGEPSILTCGGLPQVVGPNVFLQFYYDASRSWMVTQVDCPAQPAASPTVTLSANSLTFSTQPVGTVSTSKTVQLTNAGSAALTPFLTVKGSFTESNTCGQSVAPGAACMISVSFAPSASGWQSGAIAIADNASNSPQSIDLQGSGTQPTIPSSGLSAPTIGVSSTTTGLMITSAGGAATAPLTISPLGGFAGKVTISCTLVSKSQAGPVDAPTCSLTPTALMLSGGTSQTGMLSVYSSATSATGLGIKTRDPRAAILAGLFFVWLVPKKRRRINMISSLLCILAVGALAGCGVTYNKGNAAAATTLGNYQVQLVATSGDLSTSLTIPLVVQQ